MQKRDKTLKQWKRAIILLILIPLVLLSGLYVNVAVAMNRQVTEHADLTVDLFRVQSVSMLREMEIVCNNLLHNGNLIEDIRADEMETGTETFVSRILDNYLQESSYVQNIYLVCPSIDKIFSQNGVYTIDSLDMILNSLDLSYEELESCSSEGNTIIHSKSSVPCYVKKLADFGENEYGFLIATLDMNAFIRIFYSLDVEFCAIYKDEMVISSDMITRDYSGYNLSDEADVKALTGKNVKTVYREDDGYTYLVAIDREEYQRPLVIIRYWFVGYAVVIFLAMLVYLRKEAIDRYNHINAMIALLPEQYDGNMDYANVYSKVKDAFIAYRDHASAYKKELDESALYNLITAEKGENIDAYISTYSFDKYYGVNYYLMLFFFQQPLGGESQPVISANGKNSDFKKLMFHSAMEEITKTDPFLNIECCSSHHVQIAVIWGEKDHVTTEIIEKIALNASDILSEGCNEKVTAAISSPVDKPADFSKAYKEAVQIHQFAVSVNSKASIVSSERVKKDSGQLLTGEYIRKEQILINTILARKYESVPDMCDSIARQHIIPLSNEYQLANRRFESLKNILDEGVRASTIQGFEREKPLRDLAECKEIESLILLARDIYEVMVEFAEQEDSNSAIADAALRFVAHNLFDQNLTVSMICEAIDVSPQKLTRIFKSSLNMAVAEYVNYCRIEKAKELLTSTDDTTIVIAEKIGYNNSDTFTRNFKKMEGITPSDYRKSKN